MDTGALFATTATRAEESRRRQHPKYVADVFINSQMLQAIPYIVGHTLLGFYPVYRETNSLIVKTANSFTFNLSERDPEHR